MYLNSPALANLMAHKAAHFLLTCTVSLASIRLLASTQYWNSFATSQPTGLSQVATHPATAIKKISDRHVILSTIDKAYVYDGYHINELLIDWNEPPLIPNARVVDILVADREKPQLVSRNEGLFELDGPSKTFKRIQLNDENASALTDIKSALQLSEAASITLISHKPL